MKNLLNSCLSAVVLISALLAGCGGDGSIVASPTSAGSAELAITVDQSTIKVWAPANTAEPLSTATIPGIPGSYARSGSTVTVTMPRHDLYTGYWVYLDFAAGTGGTATTGKYRVTRIDASTFTVTDTGSGTITGGALMRRPIVYLDGAYTQSGTTMEIFSEAHGLNSSDTVDVVVTSGDGTNVNGYITVVDADNFVVTTPTAATATGEVTIGVGTNWATFDVAMHPSGKWLYTSSGYDCWNGRPYCWKGDVITQYQINWNTGALTYKSSTRGRASDKTSSIPVKMVFNPAGTHLAIKDDALDGIVLYALNTSTGALTSVVESLSGTTNRHGLVYSNDGRLIYNGSNVFEVVTSASSVNVALLTQGSGGNSSALVGTDLFDVRNGIRVHSVASDPASPVLTTSLSETFANALTTKNGQLLIASGWGGLKSYNFNGTTISAAAPSSGSNALQYDGADSLEGSSTMMYRSVDLNANGSKVIASYFTNKGSQAQGGLPPSGFFIASVSSDGALALTNTLDDGAKYARIAKFLSRPK